MKAIAIDTNLLVLLIVGLADVNYIERHRRLAPTYGVEQFRILCEILEKAPLIVVTAHILTEASNLSRQIAEPMRSKIMSEFQRFVGASEEIVVSADAASRRPEFLRLGLTDSAILALDPDAIQILTVDHNLNVASARAGFEVVNLTPYFFE